MRTLTASENVYFHAEQFAREKNLLDAVGLLHTDKKVDASELADAILAAALLDAERAGTIHLAPAKGSRLFGLRKVDVVEVSAGPKENAFPPGTIEARLRPLVENGPREVERVIHELLAEDSTYPDLLAIGAVHRGLLESGLLETEQQKRLGIFRTETLRLPDGTRALLAQASATEARQLLNEGAARHGDAWELVKKGIRKGIGGRKEASDGPD